MLGDAGVGKTSLVNRVTAGIFDERYLTTVGLRV
jgi:GTPase SAR1 family protein